MNLLFTEDNFSIRFRELTGYPDADIPFVKIKPSLESATYEIIELIGEDSYNEVHALDNLEDEFFRLVARAIVLKADIIYTPTASLAKTKNGLKNRNDEHTSTPWKWQVDDYQSSLLQNYYRHLDVLLRYMIKNNKSINLKKYDTKNLYVSNLETFEQFFDINGSHYMYFKLLPALVECERKEIAPRIKAITEVTDEMKFEIKAACVNYAMEWACKRLNFQIFPTGILQPNTVTESTNSKPSEKLTYAGSAQTFYEDFRSYILELEKMVSRALSSDDAVNVYVNITQDDGFLDPDLI